MFFLAVCVIFFQMELARIFFKDGRHFDLEGWPEVLLSKVWSYSTSHVFSKQIDVVSLNLFGTLKITSIFFFGGEGGFQVLDYTHLLVAWYV